jgi:cellulose synthase/poly-beta-1,6-N-acetylglucosamine synthase-like glycosyltransferase
VPSFSIIIAAYQAAAFIGAAIESALAQTLAPKEIVVCDDGSTDDIEGALAPYRDRLIVVRQENRGEGAAKNAAAREATGDFIVILDADDTYLPTRLEQLGAAAAVRPDLDILVTDAFVEVDGRVVRTAYDETWTFEVEDQRRGILERNFVLGHAAARRERFLAVGGFDDAMRTVADWDLWLRMILGGSRAGFVPEPLARYNVRAGSLSTEQEAMLRGGIQCMERGAARDDLSSEERTAVERALARHRRRLALREAQEATRLRRPDARRRLAGVALGRGYELRTRAKAAGSALLLGRAAEQLQRRDDETWVGTAGVRVEQ